MMHLEGPWMTTTKYSKKPHAKWASAEAKRRATAEEQSWTELEQRLVKLRPNFSGRVLTDPAMPRGAFKPLTESPAYPPGREPQQIPSRDSGTGVAALKQAPVYTGDKIKGIGTLHKSNAVPVFTDEEAVDLAHMRR